MAVTPGGRASTTGYRVRSGSRAGRCSSSTSSPGGRTRSGSTSRRSGTRSRATRCTGPARRVAARTALVALFLHAWRLELDVAVDGSADPRRGAAPAGAGAGARGTCARGRASHDAERSAVEGVIDGAPGGPARDRVGPIGRRQGHGHLVAVPRPDRARAVLRRDLHDPAPARVRGRRRALPLPRPGGVRAARDGPAASSRRTTSTATGTARRATRSREALAAGRDAILKIDVQGAAVVKQKVPEALLVFLVPPSLEDLFSRLQQRATETADELDIRQRNAALELARRTTTTTSCSTRPARWRGPRRASTRSSAPRRPPPPGPSHAASEVVTGRRGSSRSPSTRRAPAGQPAVHLPRARGARGPRRGGGRARRVRAAPGARDRAGARGGGPGRRDQADRRPRPHGRPPAAAARDAPGGVDRDALPRAAGAHAPRDAAAGAARAPRAGRGAAPAPTRRPDDGAAADLAPRTRRSSASLAAAPKPVRSLEAAEGRPALLRRLRALESRGLIDLDWTLLAAGAGPRWVRFVRTPRHRRRRLAPARLGPRQRALLDDLAAGPPDGLPAPELAARHGSSTIATLARRGLVAIDARERPGGRSGPGRPAPAAAGRRAAS